MRHQTPDVYHLNNGLKVVHQRIPHSQTVHCGLIVNTGSRGENDTLNGIAHLIEHCVFKGTHRRKPYHILSRIENVGGELEAFTTREKTAYFTSTLSKYAARSVELLTDILFNPVFPEKEVTKEKKVIKEEIEMYEDMPEESLMDDFHRYIFPDHALGNNILGTRASLYNISSQDLVNFHEAHYKPANMVMAITGNITPLKVSRLIDQYLAPLPGNTFSAEDSAPVKSGTFQKTIQKDFQQAYCLLGTVAYSRNDDKKYAMAVLNSLLGGTGMSSLLNLKIREKYGYVYQIDTTYIPYKDTGLFTIDFSTEKTNLDKCNELISKEMKALRKQKQGDLRLSRAKKQLIGQTTMMEENGQSLMQTLGKNLLDYNKVISLEEFSRNVENVTAIDVMEAANEVLQEESISSLIFMPGE